MYDWAKAGSEFESNVIRVVGSRTVTTSTTTFAKIENRMIPQRSFDYLYRIVKSKIHAVSPRTRNI
jgi:hypothetical protein